MREILYIAPMSEFTIKILNSLTRTLKILYTTFKALMSLFFLTF